MNFLFIPIQLCIWALIIFLLLVIKQLIKNRLYHTHTLPYKLTFIIHSFLVWLTKRWVVITATLNNLIIANMRLLLIKSIVWHFQSYKFVRILFQNTPLNFRCLLPITFQGVGLNFYIVKLTFPSFVDQTRQLIWNAHSFV